jgi:xanthine dehydrogenase iron-sulfur cluster and FAD-binding subunit A
MSSSHGLPPQMLLKVVAGSLLSEPGCGSGDVGGGTVVVGRLNVTWNKENGVILV